MKTFDEAIAQIDSSKNSTNFITDLFLRHQPMIRETANNQIVLDLCFSIMMRVANNEIDPLDGVRMAFDTGLVIGIEMEKP